MHFTSPLTTWPYTVLVWAVAALAYELQQIAGRKTSRSAEQSYGQALDRRRHLPPSPAISRYLPPSPASSLEPLNVPCDASCSCTAPRKCDASHVTPLTPYVPACGAIVTQVFLSYLKSDPFNGLDLSALVACVLALCCYMYSLPTAHCSLLAAHSSLLPADH